MKEKLDSATALAKCDRIVKAGDFLSLLAFVGVWYFYDIFEATKALIAVMVPISLGAFLWYRCAPRLQVLMVASVVIFGGLTLYFNDASFIKVRPTITFTIFAVLAFGSVFINKPFVSLFISDDVLDKAGISRQALEPLLKNISIRFGFLFIILAGMNEFIWRTQTEDFWIIYRLVGSMGMTLGFFIIHIPWFMKKMKAIEKSKKQPQKQTLSASLMALAQEKQMEKQMEKQKKDKE